MLARLVEGVAPERERAGAVAEPLDVEASHLLLEAARSEQHVGGRDAAVLEVEPAPLLTTHEARRRTDAEAGRVALDQHRADAAGAGAVAHVDQEQRRI